MRQVILIILVLLIYIILVVFFMNLNRLNNRYHVPKIIWSYWNSSDKPLLIESCIKSWEKHHPDYNIIILNEETYGQYVDIPNAKDHSIQFFTDILRLELLSKYGGWWLDSSIYMYDKISNIFNISSSKNVYCYNIGYNNKNGLSYPIIESWLIGSTVDNSFIKAWRLELLNSLNYFEKTLYLSFVKSKNINIDNISIPEYLIIHVSAQVVLQENPLYISTISYKDVYDGPFKAHYDSNWNSALILDILCTNHNERYKRTLIKFTGENRKNIDNNKLVECLLK